MRNRRLVYALIAAVLFGQAAWADIYKCTDADGGLMFSQTPCPQQNSVEPDASEPASVARDCRYAREFAFAAARLMRAGLSSSELIDRYGGVDAVSKGALGTINYVYSFRTNDDVTVERIAALADAKCEARSLGDVSCEALPPAYISNTGGCDQAAGSSVTMARGTAELPTQSTDMPGARPNSSGNRAATQSRSEKDIEQCKKPFRDAIDAIEAEILRGYTSEQGEVYRERLIGLTQQMRRC